MKSVTFAISKGGVGKSLLTANVGAALAAKGEKVVLVEGDPSRPLQLILGVKLESGGPRLESVVKRDLGIEKALYPTHFQNLFLVPSGISLERYFSINPIRFAKKLMDLNADYMLIDVPFPLGEAAFLSLGVCQYFIVILTEDEFTLCVESAIDTIRLGKHYLKCVPIGFVLNRIKTDARFSEAFVGDLEDLLEIDCIARLNEDPLVSKSYGGIKESKAFLAYDRSLVSNFHKGIDQIATRLMNELPKPEKKDAASFLQSVTKPIKI